MKECIDEKYNKNLILRYNLQFFAEGEGGEKTEPATQKKLDDARKEGKVARSKDLTEAIALVVLFLLLKVFVGDIGTRMIDMYTSVLGGIDEFYKVNRAGVYVQAITGLMYEVLIEMLLMVWPFFVFGLVIAFLVNVYQVGWQVSTKPMEPKLSKFNPINGFKRIISKDSLFELAKSILKVFVIIYIALLKPFILFCCSFLNLTMLS